MSVEALLPLCGQLRVEEVGGKALALARAAAAGMNVPPGFAITVDGVAAIEKEAVRVTVARAARDRVEAPLAVRSSAVDEDSAATAAAGVYHTVLGVSADNLHGAILEVRESGRSPSASAYRSRQGLPPQAQMAVVVQSMVAADAAGVAFGTDPVSGRPEAVVESVWGLGEPVVSGTATPDHFVLDLQTQQHRSLIARKASESRLRADGAVETVPVEPRRREQPSLDAEGLRAVVALARECDGLAGAPCEVEWALRDEELFLLQYRPVTGGASR